jgi:mRNA-degrading endonuclease toxin of MazEF toxin-antitoxin module
MRAEHANSSIASIRFKDREQCVMLSQLRLWDGKRLTHKMGQLPDDQFEAVKQALRRLLK